MHLDYISRGRWALAVLLLVGCKDDPVPGTGGSGSTGPVPEPSSTGIAGSSDGDLSASETTIGGQDGSSGGSGSSGLPIEVRMSGTIQDFFLMQPIGGASISVEDQPDLQTTSDDQGNWELLGLPVDTFGRFLVADTDTYWGAVIPFQTMFEDVEEFELSQLSLDVIDIQINALQQQDPTVMVEDDTAVLLVAIIQNTATGAVAQLDPPPDATAFYAPNADGQPILGSNEIQWSAYPVAVFFNLEPGPSGTYEITVTHPERDCTPEDPEPPTFGRHINLIRVDCPPPA